MTTRYVQPEDLPPFTDAALRAMHTDDLNRLRCAILNPTRRAQAIVELDRRRAMAAS